MYQQKGKDPKKLSVDIVFFYLQLSRNQSPEIDEVSITNNLGTDSQFKIVVSVPIFYLS